MFRHPVRFRVPQPPYRLRIHVAIRLVLLLALGAIGTSSVYWLLYLSLPALAGLLIAQKGGEGYVAENGPPVVRVLRWLAGAYAYLWLLTDDFGLRAPSPTVEFQLTPDRPPRASSALLRIVTSLPAVAVLILLTVVASVLWLIGAMWVIAVERMPAALSDFIALTLRYQFRLFAYHLSLVDTYPSLASDELPHAPEGEPLTPHVTG